MRIAFIDDFERERSRHGDFVPRRDVLEKIKQILDGDKPMARGWLPLLGGPGVGKTAILLQLLENLSGALVFYFIRRGSDSRDRPEVVERSLCAQIKQLFPECSSADSPAEVRLTDLLTTLSKRVLGPLNERLILVIDGLDELALDAPGGNPLPRFLPEVLPKGVVILCATRPKDPQRNWLFERAGVPPIDLDDKEWSASNHTACQVFWESHIDEFSPPLDRAFIEAAVERSAGNLLYAIRLRDWLIDKPLQQRVTVNIPRGLDAFLEQIWADFLALEEPSCNVVLEGLGVACAAREAVPPSLFSPILGWTSRLDVEQLLRVARPFLREVEASWHNHIKAYRLYHEWLREFIITKLGDSTMRGHHAQISRSLAAWPPSEGDAPRRLYALRHAVTHLLESGNVEAAQRLCVDVSYLERKCSALGASAVERDLEATARAVSGDAAFNLSAILAAVSAEASSLKDDPTSLATRLYNRLRCAGWSANQIESVLQFPAKKLPPMRLRHRVRMGATRLRSFLEHERPVVACAVTPDGRHLLSASADKTLRLWSIERGECVKVLRGHKDEVTACALMTGGKTAISTSTDLTTKLWDVQSGSCTGTLTHDKQAPTTCAFIRDDELFVVGFEDGTLRAWNRHSRNLVETLYGHTAYVTACAGTPDGKHLVTTSRDGTVRVWDLASFELLHTLQREDDPGAPSLRASEGLRWFTALALSSDGKTVFAASGDGLISHWNVVAGTPIRTFRVANGRIDSCAVSPEGYLLCGLADGTVLIWSLTDRKCIDRLSAHASAVSACALTRDGRRAVSASQDRSLKLWDLSAFGSVPREVHAASITACAMTPDESTAVSASEDGLLKVWELATGKRRVNLEEHKAWVTACALSTNGLRVVSGALDGNLRIWNVPSGTCIQSVQGHADRVIICAILPGDQIISASHDGWIKIWKLIDLAPVRTLGEHDALECFAVRADGASALSVSRDGTAKLWNLDNYDCERTLEDLGSGVLCCALTPDGGRAVVGREDGAIEVYDIVSGQPLATIRGHEGRVIACAVSTDGARALVTFEDETLRVFSLDTYMLVTKLQGKSKFRCVTTTNGLICAGADDGNLWMIESGMESQSSGKQPIQKRPIRSKVTKKPGGGSIVIEMDNTIIRNTRSDASSKPRQLRRSSLIARLRELLARLYPAVEDARMVVDETDLDARAIVLGGSALQFWYAILTAAENHGRLGDLASVVVQKHPGNDALTTLLLALKLID
jgi:WD40 repeat protein